MPTRESLVIIAQFNPLHARIQRGGAGGPSISTLYFEPQNIQEACCSS